MGRRGPAPTPSPILKLRGSRRAGDDKKQPGNLGEPERPEWLTNDEAAVWDALADGLRAMGVIEQAHANTLARYCNAFVRWRRAAAHIEAEGETYSLADEAGNIKCIMPRPEVAIAKALAAELTKLEQEMGLTPSSRTRIQVTTGEQETNEKGRFFRAG